MNSTLLKILIRKLKERGMIRDVLVHEARWVVRKYASDEDYRLDRPFAVSVIADNLLLNEGITALQNLLVGNAETSFGNANACLGVGDSSAAESASQTGLQAAANKLYKAMQATYPQIAGQVTTWRAVFGSAEANFDWNEFTVANGNSDSADNLNRKVSAQGTKASGQTWTLDLQITWS